MRVVVPTLATFCPSPRQTWLMLSAAMLVAAAAIVGMVMALMAKDPGTTIATRARKANRGMSLSGTNLMRGTVFSVDGNEKNQ